MGNIFSDIKTAVKMTGEIRKARKAGATAVQLRPVYRVPAVRFGYFTFTMEACLIYGDAFKAVCATFETLPEDTQHALTFTPEKPGEWVKRAKFWQQQLQPVLAPEMYHYVILTFVHWYAHCLRMRQEGAKI